MRATQRYRFRIANLCDVAQTYNASAVGQFGTTNIVIGAHDFKAGDYAYFEGFAPAINGYREIDGTDATTVRITIPSIVDVSILGTVKKINERYVTPLNFYESKFDWEQETGEIFFRKLMNTPLKFTGEDYNYFVSQILHNECCEVKFIIEKKCGGLGLFTEDDKEIITEQQWNVDWRGYFTHNSCDWNLSHCWVVASIEPDDYYRCLFSGYEDKKTVFDTISYYERIGDDCCEERILPIGLDDHGCTGVCINIIDALTDAGTDPPGLIPDQVVMPCDGSSFNDWQLERIVLTQLTSTGGGSSEVFRVCTRWIREVAISMDVAGSPSPPSGFGWHLLGSINYNGLSAHKWFRWPYNGAYRAYSNYTVTRDCDADPCVTTWEVNFPDDLDSNIDKKPLLEVATNLAVSSCGLIAGVRSDFFELNPVGDTPGYVAGFNYVTGQLSQVNNILLTQISSFLTVTSAEIEEIYSDLSLKDLLDALKIMFNCKWFVDGDGFIRIEHISWFVRSVTIDTTVGEFNIRLNKSKKHFKFDRVEIPLKEKFSFPYQGYKDFIGVEIKYNSPCVNIKKTVSYSVPKFSTDLQNIRDNANDVKDFNSFVMIAADASDVTISDVGVLTGETISNVPLSWANLHNAYYRHDRFLISGNMNNVETNFESAKKTKRQVAVCFTGCCIGIDPLADLVRTELGDGEINKMTKDNRDEVFKVELLY